MTTASEGLTGHFLSPTGMELKKVYELMNKEALRFNISLPTPTNHRKILASDAMELLKSEEI